MKRCLLIALVAGTIPQAHAQAATAEKYWEKCPGPACPASTAPPEHERTPADSGRRPASDDRVKSAREPADKAEAKKAEPKPARPAQEQRMRGY